MYGDQNIFRTQECQRLDACSQILILFGRQLDNISQAFHKRGCMINFCSQDCGWKGCPPFAGLVPHMILSPFVFWSLLMIRQKP